jgi:flagellar basal-body rod protein FlgG
MKNGLYAAASALDAYRQRMEAVAHNLANLETPGFKRTIVALGSFEKMLEKIGAPGAKTHPQLPFSGQAARATKSPASNPLFLVEARGATDFSAGDLVPTGAPLDLAIEGSGFFAVETKNGVRYTRNGVFSKNAEGILLTKSGEPVLGRNGPVSIGEAPLALVRIDLKGRVFAGEREVGALALYDFEKPYALAPEGESFFRALPHARRIEADRALVRQGFRERSNAEAVSELLSLIEAHRAFEAATRSIESVMKSLDRTTSELR